MEVLPDAKNVSLDIVAPVLRGNSIAGRMSVCGIGVWSAHVELRQVLGIVIADNTIDPVRSGEKVADVRCEQKGKYPPEGVLLSDQPVLGGRPEAEDSRRAWNDGA